MREYMEQRTEGDKLKQLYMTIESIDSWIDVHIVN